MNQPYLIEFIQKHKLDPVYASQAVEFFIPLARELMNLHHNKNKSIVVGINGAQGSGKSTLSELLVNTFATQYHLNVVTLSLDDFYYTHSERQHLAHTIHPLLATRGVPGTHDIMLAHETLDALLNHNGAQTLFIPRFNKATDDRYEQQDWSPVKNKPSIIFLEGWCVGACAQEPHDLLAPINPLEAEEDANEYWRKYVNEQLRLQYVPLFSRLECTIMLKAPSFKCVYEWRLEQEEKLIMNLENSNNGEIRTMNSSEIFRFIQHYQRLTKHILSTLPDTAEYVFSLNENRKIKSRQKNNDFNNLDIRTLIFTDLDGSLLNHHNYSHTEADNTLIYLEQNKIPVIPCSSKTQAEIENLRLDLNNQHPFIVENGAAVFIPKQYFNEQPNDTVVKGDYWVKSFVQPHEYWIEKLNTIRNTFSGLYTSFNEMSNEEIAQVTGLSLNQASLAANRQFSEPVLWLGNDKQKQNFIFALKAIKATVLQGGRFLHICGNTDKGKALMWLTNVYQQQHNQTYSTLAVGDSHNDSQMLDIADHALIIRSPVHGVPILTRINNITISEKLGPAGWAQGIQSILDHLLIHKID